MKSDLFRQNKSLPNWLGGFLIQLQQSLVYVGIFNIVMLAITMWYTAGYEIVNKYLPAVNIGHFLIVIASGWLIIIFVDYKYLTPTRLRYQNRQVAKHKNPAMELLQKVDRDNEKLHKDIEAIKKALNIEENTNGLSKK